MMFDRTFDFDWPDEKDINSQDKATKNKANEIKYVQKESQQSNFIEPVENKPNQVNQKQVKLDQLKNQLGEFAKKEFLDNFFGYSHNLVFSDGNIDSSLMLVGEAPGEQEDQELKPFVGRSGQLLTKFLKHLNYDRTNYYITNVVPWRPPGNRTPTFDEIEKLKPFLYKHIEIIGPKLIVAVGSVAAKALGIEEGITKAQGNLFKLPIGSIFCVYHPSYALRLASKKKDLWYSLLKMDQALKQILG